MSSILFPSTPLVQRTLAIRLGALGDTVLTLSALAALRQMSRQLAFVGSASAPPVLGACPWLDSVLAIDQVEGLFADRPNLARLRSLLGPVDRAVVWLRDAQAVVPALRQLGVAAIHTATSAPPPGVHVIDHLLATIGAPPGGVPELPVSAEQRARAAARLVGRGIDPKPVLVLPGAGGAAKRWPVERFAGLVDGLRAAGLAAAVVVGPADAEVGRAMRRLRPDLPVVEDVPLADLAGVLRAAALVVANDSGPAHVAAAAGAPTLALFGPTSPETWAPRGRRVGVVRAPEGDLARLGVPEVLEAALALIGAATPDGASFESAG